MGHQLKSDVIYEACRKVSVEWVCVGVELFQRLSLTFNWGIPVRPTSIVPQCLIKIREELLGGVLGRRSGFLKACTWMLQRRTIANKCVCER